MTVHDFRWKDGTERVLEVGHPLCRQCFVSASDPRKIFSSAYGKKYIVYSMNGYMQTCFKFLRDLRMLWNLVG